MVCGGCIVVAVIGVLVGLAAPTVGMILVFPAIVCGGIIGAVGGFRILLNAFAEDTLCGLLYLFLPYYSMYYLVTRWAENSRPFLLSLLGTLTMMIGMGCRIGIAVAVAAEAAGNGG